MSVVPVNDLRGASPDRPLLARLRAALDRWEATGCGPTSSLSGGGAIAALEEQLAQLCRTRYALAMASGTIALRVAAAAVGVTAGSRVIVPALDWPAAAAAVLSLGAVPVPADCAPKSILVNADSIYELVDGKTSALVITHLAGMPADMDAVMDVASEFGIPVIEDCSQAIGATHRGRHVGGCGTVGVFSLGPGKLVDAGEGGVLVTDEQSVYEAAVRATQHPARHLRVGLDPGPSLALTARLHPAAAFLGLAGLEGLPAELARRRALAEDIRERTAGGGAEIPQETWACRFSWSCVPALADDSTSDRLLAAGLGATPLGLAHIPSLLGTDASTPNANSLHPLARRLFRLRLSAA